MYCGHGGAERPENWNFYMAFAFFRLAAALQGLCKQSEAGEEPTTPALHRAHTQTGLLSLSGWLSCPANRRKGEREHTQSIPQQLLLAGCWSHRGCWVLSFMRGLSRVQSSRLCPTGGAPRPSN